MTHTRGASEGSPWLVALILAGLSLTILAVLSPGWILSSTTPTGGDMGAHVYGPAFLRDELLQRGQILGWSSDWFAGFPAFYFYFPLPSLTIVLLDLVLPYGVAFKVVTILGLLALPPAAFYLARSMKLGKSVSLVAAASAVAFVFFESYTIYGGNVASTLAGEFSYSWSFALSLVYLSLLMRGVRDDRRYLKWAAVALAATALSHVLTTIVAVFASLFVLAWSKGLWRTIAVWIWGFGLAAFWALPLVARIGLTSDMAWTPLSRWEEVFPVEIWLILPVAIPGAIWAMRRSRRAGPLIGATLLPVIYYPLPNLMPNLFPDVFDGERWKLWNGRLLPYWYFGLAFFAGVAVGALVLWASRRLPSRVSVNWARLLVALAAGVAAVLMSRSEELPDWAWIPVLGAGAVLLGLTVLLDRTLGTRTLLTVTAVGLLGLGALAGVTFIDGWARWNYEGYESKGPWPEYEALMAEIDQLPDGRVHWEANHDLNQYGTPMSPMLIPYWTEGSHQSMEGLFFESSLTTPFHFINSSEMSKSPSNPIPGLPYHTFDMARGVKHLEFFGVSYYVSFTPEAAEKADTMPDLSRVATTGPFVIYELPEPKLIEASAYQPSVYAVPDQGLFDTLTGSPSVTGEDGQPLPSFFDMALDWYSDVDNLDRWVAADGPADWPRIETLGERPTQRIPGTEDAVSEVVIDDEVISFHTEAVGVPHLIKVSYFPNWVAEGADGPWRAAPSIMMVVPTQSDVVLRFESTWAETFGLYLSVAALLGLLGVGLVLRSRRGNAAR